MPTRVEGQLTRNRLLGLGLILIVGIVAVFLLPLHVARAGAMVAFALLAGLKAQAHRKAQRHWLSRLCFGVALLFAMAATAAVLSEAGREFPLWVRTGPSIAALSGVLAILIAESWPQQQSRK